MFRFTLLRIPVTVEPLFWLMGFILGGGLDIKIDERDSLIGTLIFMGACFVSIMVHEYGHALSARRLAGGQQAVRLWAFGGLAYNRHGSWVPRTKILMTLAGPGAGFLLFFLVAIGIILGLGAEPGLDYLQTCVIGSSINHREVILFIENYFYLHQLLYSLIWINLWWGLVNLLPIHPLDGGQVAMEISPSRIRVHRIGFFFALGMVIVGIFSGSMFIAIMFGFLAWQNYTATKMTSKPRWA